MGTWDVYLLQKLHEYEQRIGSRVTVTEFAAFLGEEQPTVSRWLSGKSAPDRVKADRLADLLGDETYDALGLPRPDPILRYIIRNWDHLSPDAKRAIHDDITRYLESQKPSTRGGHTPQPADTT